MSSSDKVIFEIVGGFSVAGKRIFIRLGDLVGYGKGSKTAAKIIPATACFVVREDKSYRVINPDDPRINNILSAYDRHTEVECIYISNKKDEVTFFTNELLPQQSSYTEFDKLIKELKVSEEKQKLVSDYFCGASSRKDSIFNFNINEFIKLLGNRTPKYTTILNYFKSPKKQAKDYITLPKQLVDNDQEPNPDELSASSQPAVTDQQAAIDQQPVLDQQATDQQELTNIEGRSEIGLGGTNTPEPANLATTNHANNFDISNELKERWVRHVSSSFTIDQVIERLRSESVDYQKVFEARLSLDETSDEFAAFVTNINKFMGSSGDG